MNRDRETTATFTTLKDLAAIAVCTKLRWRMAPRFPKSEDYARALEEAGLRKPHRTSEPRGDGMSRFVTRPKSS